MNNISYLHSMSVEEVVKYCMPEDIGYVVITTLDKIKELEKELKLADRRVELAEEQTYFRDYVLEQILEGIETTTIHKDLAKLIKQAYENSNIEN